MFSLSKLSLALLVLIISLSASASSTESITKVNAPYEDVNEQERKQIKRLIHSSLKNLKTLEVPSFTSVTVYRNTDNPSYFNYTLTVPYEFSFPHPDTRVLQEKSFDTTKAVILHEVGHAVFDHNLRLEFPEWKRYKEEFIEYREVRIKYRNLSGDFDWGVYNSVDHPQEYQQLEKLRKKLDEFEAFFTSFPFDHFVQAYEELYADTFAVYFLKNPSAISSSISFTNDHTVLSQFPAIIGRDFAIEHPIEGYDINGVQSSQSIHLYFSYVRSFILKEFDINTDGGKVITILFKAIADEIRERSTSQSLRNLNMREANLRLIEKIKKKSKALSK